METSAGGGRFKGGGRGEEGGEQAPTGSKAEAVEIHILRIPAPPLSHIHHVNIPTAKPSG